MKMKYISCLLASCVILSSPQAFAMEGQKEEDKGSVTQVVPRSLQEQLETVSKFVAQRKEANLPVEMVLGATNKQGDRFPEEGWIFFDYDSSQDPKGRPYIQGDFNSLSDLADTAKAIGPNLDKMIIDNDGLTFKFTEWGVEHVKLLGSMLSEAGEFTFSPYPLSSARSDTRYGMLSDHNKIWEVLKEFNSYSPNKIQAKSAYTKPYIVASPEDLKTPEVDELVAKYTLLKDFTSLDPIAFNQKARKVGIQGDSFLPPHIVADDQKIRSSVAQRVKEKKIMRKFEDEVYIPHITHVLMQCFGVVEFQENYRFVCQSPLRNN